MSGIKDILIKAKQPVNKQKPAKEVVKKSKNGYQSIINRAIKDYAPKTETPSFWKAK